MIRLRGLHKVLAQILSDDSQDTVLYPPGAPVIAPPDTPIFGIEADDSIAEYEQDIFKVDTFEEFLELLQKVVLKLNLSPASDTTNVAAVMNRLRVKQGLEPL